MKRAFKEIFSGVSLAAILLLFVFFVTFAWTNPTEPPPGGSGIITAGEGIYAGNIGVNTATPEFKLDVNAEGASNSGFRASGVSTFVDKLGVGIKDADNVKEKLHISDGSILQNNPANPKIISGGDKLVNLLPDLALAVTVSGKYAYVIFAHESAENYKAFRILDVSNPANPKIVGGAEIIGLPTCCYPADISVSGKYAYVIFKGSKENAFRIIDISNPSDPQVLGGSNLTDKMPTSVLSALTSSGRYVYVAFSAPGSEAFRIIDVSDPRRPFVVGGHNLTLTDIPVKTMPGIHVIGRYVYLNLKCDVTVIDECENGEHSFRVIDILDPRNPKVVGDKISDPLNLNLPKRTFNKSYVSGGYAYISLLPPTQTGADPMLVLDISNPTDPKLVGKMTYAQDVSVPEASAFAIGGAGNYAYLGFIGTGDGSFRIVDVSDPTNPVAVGGHNLNDMPGYNSDIFVAGRYVYLTFAISNAINTNNTFRIIDPTGIEAVSGSIHSLETGSVIIREKASIGSDLELKGGLNVGGDILNAGGISIGGDFFIKIPDQSGIVKAGGIRIFVKETAINQSCETACGPGPTDCLSAFDSDGNNISCSTASSKQGRCLCTFFGSGIIPD